MSYREIESPVGPLLLAGDDEGLRFLLFKKGRDKARPKSESEPDRSSLKESAKQLGAYFAGGCGFRAALAPQGTPFQTAVWSALLKIPTAKRKLRSDRRPSRQSQSGARRRSRTAPIRSRSSFRATVSSAQRLADRLRRRVADQAGTARARAGERTLLSAVPKFRGSEFRGLPNRGEVAIRGNQMQPRTEIAEPQNHRKSEPREP